MNLPLHTRTLDEPLLTTSENTTEPVPVKLDKSEKPTELVHPYEKTISIPVRIFELILFSDRRHKVLLDDPLLGDSREVFPELAALLKSIDPEERIWHVEEPGKYNDLPNPVAWRRAEWMMQKCLLQIDHDKRIEELAARELCQAKLQELLTAYARDTGSEVYPKFIKMAEPMMLNVLIYRNTVFADMLGVNIESITKEMIDLVFKNNPLYQKAKMEGMI